MRAPVRRDGLRLGQRQYRLAGTRHAPDCRPGLVGEDVEDPLLGVGQAPQALLLVLDLAPHDRDQLVLRKQRRADGLHAAAAQRPVAGAVEAAKDPPDRRVDLPQAGRIQDQFAQDARRQLPVDPAVGERHREAVGKGQVVAGASELALHQADDIVHAALRLGEGVLVEQAQFAAHVANPLPAVEEQGAALDFYEEEAAIGIEQHEIAFALLDGAGAAAGQPVEAVEDLDAVGEVLDQGAGDGALAGVGDFGGGEGGEEFGHGVPLGWGRYFY